MRETNLYKLSGLKTVSARYQFYEIHGNGMSGPEYYSGVIRLQRSLVRSNRRPFAVIQRGDVMHLAVPEDVVDNLATDHSLGRWVATLIPNGDLVEIDCSVCGDELDPVRLQFLNFLVRTPLYQHPDLWRPRAGDGFYHRTPAATREGVDIFEGVSARVVPYPNGGYGVLLEAKTKLISARSIGARAKANDIRRMSGSSCLYRMGDRWFEISVSGAGRTVSDRILIEDGKPVSLKEYLHTHAEGQIAKSLINLDGNGAVVNYRGSDTAQVKAAPAELCYRVLDTHTDRGAKLQRQTIQVPDQRRSKAHQFKKFYLENIRLGNSRIVIADSAAELQTQPFALPDLLFGRDHKLFGSTRSGARPDVRRYAKDRRRFMERHDVGLFEAAPLEAQTLILPKSVMRGWGPSFVKDFTAEVHRLHPNSGYRPTVVTFDDLSEPVSSASQAQGILKLARDNEIQAGDCAIMIKRTKGSARKQDKLPALLMNKLRKDFGINAAVFHTTTPEKAYHRVGTGPEARYVRKDDPRGRFSGYLTGAALNKVLIPNANWPFVLADDLKADVIFGIDVKDYTAGIVMVAEGGRTILHDLKTSNKQEKLTAGIVENLLTDLLTQEAEHLTKLTRRIVIHRDGRVFPSEIVGLRSACQALADDGLIAENFELSVFEIGKSSPAPLRIFKVDSQNRGKQHVNNPDLGEWLALSEGEGYVCTTGAPLVLGGTARPLHVTRATGPMSMEEALHDIFQLSCLTWTRPESSSRLPITLKLCDMFLKDEGAAHDEDDILYGSDNDTKETA